MWISLTLALDFIPNSDCCISRYLRFPLIGECGVTNRCLAQVQRWFRNGIFLLQAVMLTVPVRLWLSQPGQDKGTTLSWASLLLPGVWWRWQLSCFLVLPSVLLA